MRFAQVAAHGSDLESASYWFSLGRGGLSLTSHRFVARCRSFSSCFVIRKSTEHSLCIPYWNNPFWSNCQMIPMLRAWSGSEDSLLSGSVIERHSSVCFVAFE